MSTTEIQFDQLAKLTDAQRRELGMRRWSTTDEDWAGESSLWLFPASWYDRIPNGFETVSISGRRHKFYRGATDRDQRAGMLAFGILVAARLTPGARATLYPCADPDTGDSRR